MYLLPLVMTMVLIVSVFAEYRQNVASAHSSTPYIQENSLTVTVAPSSIANRSEFLLVTAAVQAHRTGAGSNTGWSIQLSFPPDYILTSGQNPQVNSTFSHGSAVVSWTLTAPPTPSAAQVFTVTASAFDASTGLPLSGSPEIDNFTITTVNRPPAAQDDSVMIEEDTTSTTISVLSNDTDPDNDVLLVSAIASLPNNGTAFITDGNSTITYSPHPDFFGVDSFEYVITDGFDGLDSGSVFVTVLPVNDAPVPTDDFADLSEDSSVSFDATANDLDIDSEILSVVSITEPSNGAASLNTTDNRITYIPDPNFFGIDSMDYNVSDGDGGIGTASITFSVTAVNDAPVATSGSFQSLDAKPVRIELDGRDIDGDGLTFIVVQLPSHGFLSVFNATSGEIVYTPDMRYRGQDSITFVVNDGLVNSTFASISITVEEVADDEASEETQDSSRGSNNRIQSESELAAKRLTHEESYFIEFPLSRIQVLSHAIVNTEGRMFSSVRALEEVVFSYDIRNYQQHAQQYYFLIQITDESDLVQSIQYSQGLIERAGVGHVELDWSPAVEGEYLVEAMIVTNLETSPVLLAEMDLMALNVRA